MSKTFSREMKKGNVNCAMKIVTDNMKNSVLPLTGQTLNQLQLKYPEGISIISRNIANRYTRNNPSY